MRRKLLLGIMGLLLVSQAFQPDRSVDPANEEDDLTHHARPSAYVEDLLRSACYDCHSTRTTYPWYAHVTPVNFWLQHHINEGREEFNMSAWGAKSAKWRDHKKKDALRELEKKGMPLDSYTWLHKEARLSDEQRDSLIVFFKGL